WGRKICPTTTWRESCPRCSAAPCDSSRSLRKPSSPDSSSAECPRAWPKQTSTCGLPTTRDSTRANRALQSRPLQRAFGNGVREYSNRAIRFRKFREEDRGRRARECDNTVKGTRLPRKGRGCQTILGN